jgi:protease I
MRKLSGKRVAILVTDGFEQVEMTEPRTALEDEGAEVHIVSPSPKRVRSWVFSRWGRSYRVDVPVSFADPKQYDALVLPGGTINPDRLRRDEVAIRFIRSFADAGKPIASICHGPWTLIEAGVVRGKTMTSWPSLRTDLRNAGAKWVDQEVAVDGKLLTSRKPDDIPAFNRRMVELFVKNLAPRERDRGARI